MGTSLISLHPGSPHTNTSYQHEIRRTHNYTPQTVKLYDANNPFPHGRRHLETDDVTRRPPPSGHRDQDGGHTPSVVPKTNECNTENTHHTPITPHYNTLYVHKGDYATATASQPAAAPSLAAEAHIPPTDIHTNAHALPTPIDFNSIKAACEIDVINNTTTRDPHASQQTRQHWASTGIVLASRGSKGPVLPIPIHFYAITASMNRFSAGNVPFAITNMPVPAQYRQSN